MLKLSYGNYITLDKRYFSPVWEEPQDGTRISNVWLEAALKKGSRDFTKKDLGKLTASPMSGLSYDCYVQVDGCYFRPAGNKIDNPALEAALLEKMDFTRAKFVELEVSNLSQDSYIKVGDRFFKPAELAFFKKNNSSVTYSFEVKFPNAVQQKTIREVFLTTDGINTAILGLRWEKVSEWEMCLLEKEGKEFKSDKLMAELKRERGRESSHEELQITE